MRQVMPGSVQGKSLLLTAVLFIIMVKTTHVQRSRQITQVM
jgi:hypothetical protein